MSTVFETDDDSISLLMSIVWLFSDSILLSGLSGSSELDIK